MDDGSPRNNRSRGVVDTSSRGGGGVAYGGGGGGPLSSSTIKNRIESINETKTATFGGLQVRYAYLTQRGYYPDGA